MEQLQYYFKISLVSIKRAPLPYLLTVLILSLGLGMFFANATFYYRLNSDPLPQKSDKLFFPMMLLVPGDCDSGCEPPPVLSYSNVQKLGSSGIPTAQAAMYSSDSYVRLDSKQQPLPVRLRLTQRDFFQLFDVPVIAGSIWPDNSARYEVVIGKQLAEKLYGTADVVGKSLLVDDRHFTISAVINPWQMLPRLYDANNGSHISETEQLFMPLETAYDLNYMSATMSRTMDDTDYRQLATQGRTGALHQLQFWVQLDTPAQQKAYKDFMLQLAQSEQAAGRHPVHINNQLPALRDIVRYFGRESGDVKAYALVTLLFLVVCVFNASHLSLNRYISNQYEFSLRRALGASRWQLQQQLLVDVVVLTCITLVFALLIGAASIQLMNYLWPFNSLFASWDLTLLSALLLLSLCCSYLVTLYPSLRASFGALNQQLKE